MNRLGLEFRIADIILAVCAVGIVVLFGALIYLTIALAHEAAAESAPRKCECKP